MDDLIRAGGTVDINCNGLGGCVVCGWRGVPNYEGTGEREKDRRPAPNTAIMMTAPRRGTPSTYCPCCHFGEPGWGRNELNLHPPAPTQLPTGRAATPRSKKKAARRARKRNR